MPQFFVFLISGRKHFSLIQLNLFNSIKCCSKDRLRRRTVIHSSKDKVTLSCSNSVVMYQGCYHVEIIECRRHISTVVVYKISSWNIQLVRPSWILLGAFPKSSPPFWDINSIIQIFFFYQERINWKVWVSNFILYFSGPIFSRALRWSSCIFSRSGIKISTN